jgi:hypothetical protein
MIDTIMEITSGATVSQKCSRAAPPVLNFVNTVALLLLPWTPSPSRFLFIDGCIPWSRNWFSSSWRLYLNRCGVWLDFLRFPSSIRQVVSEFSPFVGISVSPYFCDRKNRNPWCTGNIQLKKRRPDSARFKGLLTSAPPELNSRPNPRSSSTESPFLLIALPYPYPVYLETIANRILNVCAPNLQFKNTTHIV